MIESLSSKSFDIKYAQLLFAHRHQKSQADHMDMLNKFHTEYDVRNEDNDEEEDDKISEQPERVRFYADNLSSPKFYDDSSYQESKKSAPSSLFTIDSILAPSRATATAMSPISHATALLRHPLQLGLAAAAAASSSADFLSKCFVLLFLLSQWYSRRNGRYRQSCTSHTFYFDESAT